MPPPPPLSTNGVVRGKACPDINFVNNELPASTRNFTRPPSVVSSLPRAPALPREREERARRRIVVTTRAYLTGELREIFPRRDQARRHLQNNYESSLFPSAIVRPGPVKGGPNFEIHCAPLYAAALISEREGGRGGAYDALKMNKTGRLNIRRAPVQKFTSAHTHTCTRACRERGERTRKGGR